MWHIATKECIDCFLPLLSCQPQATIQISPYPLSRLLELLVCPFWPFRFCVIEPLPRFELLRKSMKIKSKVIAYKITLFPLALRLEHHNHDVIVAVCSHCQETENRLAVHSWQRSSQYYSKPDIKRR